MSSFHISAILIAASLIFMVSGRHRQGKYTLCPNPADIFPCTCNMDLLFKMHMTCSSVADHKELAGVFNATFSFKKFQSLTIMHNWNLIVLKEGVFGEVTFQEFYIKYTSLKEVEKGALTGSISRVTKMDFRSNNLSTLPFEDIKLCTRLTDLYVSNNNLQEFPKIESPTITQLDLAKNPFTSIPAESLQGLPALQILYLYRCRINEIFPGTFTGLKHLSYLTLAKNDLTRLQSFTIELHGKFSQLFFDFNNITTVANDSFTGIEDFMNMSDNNLVELEEGVWRPVLEAGMILHLQNNPLACGCDMAWLVRNSELMSLVTKLTTCGDGTPFTNLHPDDYTVC